MMKSIFFAATSVLALMAGCAGNDGQGSDPTPQANESVGQSSEALTCGDVGSVCTFGGQCCSALCSGGICQKPAVCRIKTAFCNVGSDCCSGSCVTHHCQ